MPTTMRYLAVLEKTSTGYCVYFPDVLGCISEGETVEATLEFHLEEEKDLPEAHSLEWHLQNGLNLEAESLIGNVSYQPHQVAFA